MRRALLVSAILASAAAGEIIDRIAVTAGRQVITESQIAEEARLASFLNGEPLETSREAKQKIAERLVERTLLLRDIARYRYPQPGAAAVAAMKAPLVARSGGEAGYAAALQAHGLSEAQVDRHLALQLQVVSYIDQRFRGGQIEEADIAAAYQKRTEEWRNRNSGEPPPLEAVRGEIAALLGRQQADRALDNWLRDERSRERIVWHQEVFR